jgi:hypothetical protein
MRRQVRPQMIPRTRCRGLSAREENSVRHTYFVPVRANNAGTLTLQTGRLRSGERVGLAFTTDSSLALTLGPAQRWIRLDLEALTEMLVPLGVEHVRIDPHRVGEPRHRACTGVGRRAHASSVGSQQPGEQPGEQPGDRSALSRGRRMLLDARGPH